MYRELLCAGEYDSYEEYSYLQAQARAEFEEELAEEQAREEYSKEVQQNALGGLL